MPCNHPSKRNVHPSDMKMHQRELYIHSKCGTAVSIEVGLAVATLTHVSHNCISTGTRETVAATKIVVNTWVNTATSKTRVSTATNQQPVNLDHEFVQVLFRKISISRNRSGLTRHMVTPPIIKPYPARVGEKTREQRHRYPSRYMPYRLQRRCQHINRSCVTPQPATH